MSDSDDDSLQNNVFTFQNENMTISARGPNINNTNITGLSFRNNVLTSTLQMPVNFERQRYGESSCDQRSIYYRRETSPMSLRSDMGPRNFNRSYYPNGMSVHRPGFNGRCGSPMSVRSIDSTASVSAADIVFAFKNVKFNNRDLRAIKEAYSKLIKTKQRKRIEKRRNLKLFLKGARRKSGDDSGEQGSDSSISSDDCRSVKTTICKENFPHSRHLPIDTHASTNIRESNIYKDCTESFKQNTFRNMFAIGNNTLNCGTKENGANTSVKLTNTSAVTVQNCSVITQKERFKKGFLLPSQRFNKSVAGQANSVKDKNTTKANENCKALNKAGSDSDPEEIFSGFPIKENGNHKVDSQRKRMLDVEDNSCPGNKKSKLDSPKQPKNSVHNENNFKGNEKSKDNDFIFVKPKMPLKKCNAKKDLMPERLLAKSREPPIAEEEDFNLAPKILHSTTSSPKAVQNDAAQSDMTQPSSDVSMRPSFIKRKLFTQKLDVAENKNLSSDSLGSNSPQNIYSVAIKERNKARKLVSSQSCLSREVIGEDNNVLDLIHKIVPPDQINMTSIANKTETLPNKSNDADSKERWDITSVISNCNAADESETYSDEEIFIVTDKTTKTTPQKAKMTQCKIVVEKLNSQLMENALNNNNKIMDSMIQRKDENKRSVTDCVKSFWDTDFESDMEFNVAPSSRSNLRKSQETIPQKRNSNTEDKANNVNKRAPIVKGTILTVRNCQKDSKLNASLMSQKSQITKDVKVTEVKESNSTIHNIQEQRTKKNNDQSSAKSQPVTKKTNQVTSNAEENISSKNKPQDKKELARKSKAKICNDCNNTDKTNTGISNQLNRSTNIKQKDTKLDSNKKPTKDIVFNNSLPIPTSQKSKVKKNPRTPQNKQVTKILNKNHKTVEKKTTTANSNKQIVVNNVRIQPKRKSKEKSYIESPAIKRSKNSNRTLNNSTISQHSIDMASKNSSLNKLNTRTRSAKDKVSYDSSGLDQSSVNISNISGRSLRVRQKRIFEY